MTDEALARKAQRGDQQAFMDLAHRYQNVIYRIAYRFTGSTEDALDLSQSCLVRAYSNISRYDAGRPFKPWLMRLCANACLNWARQASRTRAAEAPIEDETVLATDDVEAVVLGSAERLAVAEAVRQLGPELRLPIIMRFTLGKTLREISEETGVKLPTVASRITRGIELLRSALQGSEVFGHDL